METPHYSDTIDLSKVFSQLIQLITENFKTIILTTVLCVAGGMLFFWFAPKKFESKMIIESEILSEPYFLKLAENLNKHIYNNDIDYLSPLLDLTTQETKLLVGFEMVSTLSPTIQSKEEDKKIIMVIVVRVSDNVILPKLQKGIIQYLNNNDYARKEFEENKKYYEKVIAAYDHELKMMDTLKMKLSRERYSSTKEGTMIFDLGKIFETAGNLYEKKYSTERLLSTVDAVRVIEGLTPYNKPIWPKLSIVLISSILLAGATAAFVIFVSTNRKSNSSTAA